MPSGFPVTPETRARAVALIEAGELGRNAITRQLRSEGHEVSTATVTNIARDVGHVFDHTQTEVAVAAQTIELKAIRGTLAKAAALRALEALEAMRAPTEYSHFHAGSEFREPGFVREVLDTPTIGDQRNLMTIFGIGVQRMAELSRAEDGGGVPEGLSVLSQLGADLQRAAAALEGVDPTAVPVADD